MGESLLAPERPQAGLHRLRRSPSGGDRAARTRRCIAARRGPSPGCPGPGGNARRCSRPAPMPGGRMTIGLRGKATAIPVVKSGWAWRRRPRRSTSTGVWDGLGEKHPAEARRLDVPGQAAPASAQVAASAIRSKSICASFGAGLISRKCPRFISRITSPPTLVRASNTASGADVRIAPPASELDRRVAQASPVASRAT